MDMIAVVAATAIVGIVGLLIGVLLGVASEKFKVEVDEKEILVRAELPGNNCGGCGFAGCDALAKAIALDRLQSAPARSAALRLLKRSARSWAYLQRLQRRRSLL